MRRPVWLRALAAIWAIWLQAALLDPGAFDRCPEHGHIAPAAAMQIAGHMAHAGNPAHDHGERHNQHSCTCLGACCCAPAVAVTAPAIDAPVVLTTARIVAPHVDVRVAPAARPHSLPFANGPPSTTPRALTA